MATPIEERVDEILARLHERNSDLRHLTGGERSFAAMNRSDAREAFSLINTIAEEIRRECIMLGNSATMLGLGGLTERMERTEKMATMVKNVAHNYFLFTRREGDDD